MTTSLAHATAALCALGLACSSPGPSPAPAEPSKEPERVAPTEAPAPKVSLNHVYLYVDSSTYGAVGTSDLVGNVLGVREQRTTVTKSGASWSGTYVYGQNTYFELFDGGRGDDADTSSFGIGYGVDEPGASKAVAEALARLGSVRTELLERTVGDDAVPWFHRTLVERGDGELQSWVMEYHPDFLARWHAEEPPPPGAVTRRAILQRYAAKLGQDPSDRLLGDVTAVHFELSPALSQQLASELGALGWTETPGPPPRFTGPDVTFVVATAEPSRGITKLELRLARPHDGPSQVELGSSTLTFAGTTATWTF